MRNVLFVALLLVCSGVAAQPAFDEWDRENSVHQEGNWITILMSPGDCYVKSGDGEYLYVSMRTGEAPALFVPEMHAVVSYSYWVDGDTPQHINIEGESQKYPLRMPVSVLERLKAGKTLSLRVASHYPGACRAGVCSQPKLEVTAHVIDLRGLQGALKATERGRCRK